jgi:hypothetical protein
MSHRRGNPAVDCTGEIFGYFTVKRRAGSMGQTSTWWCLDARSGAEVIKSRQELRRVKLKEDRRATGIIHT